MGSWNETCGISNLPIHYGDKVRLFILEQGSGTRHTGGGTCYINEWWTPIAAPVAGTYNDYGSISEIKEEPARQFLLETLREKMLPFDTGKLSGHLDKIVPIQEMDLEELILCIERDLAKTKDYAGKTVSLGIMFVLEPVYQALLEYNPIETQSIRQGYWLYKPYKEILDSDFEAWYKEKLEKFQQDLKEAENLKDDFKKSYAYFSVHTRDDGRMWWDSRFIAINNIRRQLTKFIENQNDWTSPEVQNLVLLCKELIQVDNAMTAARKFWSPQTGKGGQHGELGIYKLLNKTSEKIIKEREEEAIDEGSEVPDENGYYSYMLEHNEAQRLKNDES